MVRSIPAWAGKPPCWERRGLVPTVYPRVGGETRCESSDMLNSAGLSPRGRGNQWPYADFLPLIYRFDRLFEAQGWLTRTKL